MTGTCLYVPIHFLPFFFFFFLLSSRNIVRSCNRVSEGKKAGQTILIAQEQDERWPTFFFDVKERKKPTKLLQYDVKGGAKGSSMIHVALFSVAFYIYIYVCISFVLYLC